LRDNWFGTNERVEREESHAPQIWVAFESTQALVDFARSILPRELTPQERKTFFLDSEPESQSSP
jgi:hypothetical protein